MEDNLNGFNGYEQPNPYTEMPEPNYQAPGYEEHGEYPGVGFFEALKICMKEKYFDFTGRARRSEFWWFQLWLLIFYIGYIVVSGIFIGLMISSRSMGSEGIFLFYAFTIICGFAILIPTMAVAFRRLHDVGYSGWLLGGFLLASVILRIVLLMMMPSSYGIHSYEELYAARDTVETIETINLVWLGISLLYSIFLLVLYCLDGKREENTWGESPKYY